MSAEEYKGDWGALINFSKNNEFKHYSFDFWDTIAFSNSEFKIARANYIYELLLGKFEKEIINSAFSSVGNEFNLSIEMGAPTLSINDLYLKVFENIGVINEFNLESITAYIYTLFLKYPPIVSNKFLDFLNTINLRDCTLSITSNTAFIPGFVIEEYLDQLGILGKFSFSVFSDVELDSKPSLAIFNKVVTLAKTVNEISIAKDVIHIGDNIVTDFHGAENAGLTAFYLINSNQLRNPRYSLHKIKDIENLPLSPEQYSKFKFGDYSIAAKYGQELFEFFKLGLMIDLIKTHKSFIIYSSPYAKIPTASFYLTQIFIESFRKYLTNSGNDGIEVKMGKIDRCQTYHQDYGAMNAEERYNLIKNDTYKIESNPTVNDVCVFIDDISITGTHQKVVENLLSKNKINSKSVFLYYAMLDNPEVCPTFENTLNYAYMNDFDKLVQILKSNTYKITTRATKYILSIDQKDLEMMFIHIPVSQMYSFWDEIIKMSYLNDYNNMEAYAINLRTIEAQVYVKEGV
jgi:FMN phosphatase YigB (HAD superfamily)